jgi:hypothetical protein
MSENTRRNPRSIGLASLFAVLVILCLMIFAVLARLSAQSELKLARKVAESVLIYYDAEYRAVLKLHELTASGTFTEEIDENRELRVSVVITEDGMSINEWAITLKGTERQEEAPKFGGPMMF